MIRIERSDGRLFQFQEGDVAAFLRANPGAQVVPGRGPSDQVTPAEVAATVALAAGPPNFAALRRADLDAYAAERGINTSGASSKAEVVERIEAAQVEEGAEETLAEEA